MSDIIRLIQREVPIGEHVLLTLTTGKEVSGILVEIGRSHVIIEQEKKRRILMSQIIGGCEVQEEQSEPATSRLENQEEDSMIGSREVQKEQSEPATSRLENQEEDKIEKAETDNDSQVNTQDERYLSIESTEKDNGFQANTQNDKSSSVESYEKSEMALAKVKEKVTPKPTSNKSAILSSSTHEPAPLLNGSSPFASAKRAKDLKDLPQAVKLFRLAIQQGDNTESALKNLASLLVQLERPEEAIEELQKHRDKMVNPKSIDNMLVGFYQKAKQYDKAVRLLENFRQTASTAAEKFQFLWQIAYCETKQENYSRAEQHWKEILQKEPENISAQRNLSICFYKQDRIEEAEKIRNLKSEMALAEVKEKVTPKPTSNKSAILSSSTHEPAPLLNGSSPFASAKRAKDLKDLPQAVKLFRLAIQQGDNTESALKNLASLLVQLERPEEAIEELQKHRDKMVNPKSIDNMLVGFYQKAKQYDKAVRLLENFRQTASTAAEKFQFLWQIAYCETKQENYSRAEQHWKEILQKEPENIQAKSNLSICFSKQDRLEEAEKILNPIIKVSSESKTMDLYEPVKRAKTGKSEQGDEIIIQMRLLEFEFSSEISNFAKFFLARCNFRGIEPERVGMDDAGQKSYKGSLKDAHYDLERLEDFAKQQGTRRPSERADYYLTAAKIEEKEKSNQFYQYLCRSFASKGDAAVREKKHLDVAREFYCESVSVYDGYQKPRQSYESYDEQDAVNALCRFLYSYLGRDAIPTFLPKREYDKKKTVLKHQLQYIDTTIKEVITQHSQKKTVFDAIVYLIFRSNYAGNRILNSLFNQLALREKSIQYLKEKGILVTVLDDLRDFAALWKELRRKISDEKDALAREFEFIGRVELTTTSLEDRIERVKKLILRPFFELDQERVRKLQQLFEVGCDLCKKTSFEDQERLCQDINNRCQNLLNKETEENPTQLSVEEIYPVIQIIQYKVNSKLEQLYQHSAPQISIRLAMESYTLDDNQQIEIQVVVSNKIGCSPAESLELFVPENEETPFSLQKEIGLDGSLRGGEQQILRVPLYVSEQAIYSETFSLSVYAKYATRSKDITETPAENFSIRLDSYQAFEEIENPYATYAEGGIVGEKEMFYGRGEFINNVANALQTSSTQSKCVVIFGQKRAGKSSILEHLKRKLQEQNNNFILELDMGSIIDGKSSEEEPNSEQKSDSSKLYKNILWSILTKLKYVIEDKEDDGFPALGLSFPHYKDFYQHPSSLICFKDTFDAYKRKSTKLDKWQNSHVVLSIDEFSYIHEQIIKGRVPDSFMKNWKSLLKENYFSAVLVGQDVMPKFKQQFPNEFGTTQDERVSYLREEDARQLIDEPIRIGGREGESRYREKAIDLIYELTAGSPFYIQIICNRLVEYMNRKRARLVTDSDVKQVKNELLRGVNALSLDKFDNLINSGDTSEDAIKDEDALDVLIEIAKNGQTGPCNRNSIICETDTPINNILDDLVKRDIVECQSMQYYQIRVDLFKEWLITNR